MNHRSFALALLLATTTVALTPPPARAQELAGAVNAGAAIADGDAGGGLWVDLFAAFDWFRLGGFLGAYVIPSARDSHNRLATPAGLAVAAVANLGDVDLELRLRGGLWGGSTQEVKLTAGGFLGGGAFFAIHLGGGASVGAGVEIWGLLGAGATWAVAPTLTLTFGPAPAASPPSTSPGESTAF